MNRTIYVYATDKFLSGWGCASGKIHKQIAICPNWEEANRMLRGFENDSSYKSINWSYDKPYFRPSKYTSTFRPSSAFTIYK